ASTCCVISSGAVFGLSLLRNFSTITGHGISSSFLIEIRFNSSTFLRSSLVFGFNMSILIVFIVQVNDLLAKTVLKIACAEHYSSNHHQVAMENNRPIRF